MQSNKSLRLRKPSVTLVSSPGIAYGWVPINIAKLKAFLLNNDYEVDNLPLCVEYSDYIAQKYPYLIPVDKQIGEFGYNWHELYFSSLLFRHRRPDYLIRQSVRDLHMNRDIYRTQLDFGENSTIALDVRRVAVEAKRILRYCSLMHQFLIHRLESINWANVDIVGFSCLESQFLTNLFMSRHLRQRYGNRLIIVFGGPMFQSYNSEVILRYFNEFDHLVVGDGEYALLRILQGFGSGDRSPRLVSDLTNPLSEDTVNRNNNEIERYPPPNYDEIKKTRAHKYSLATYMARGCSYWRCSFCPINVKGQRVRPAQVVFKEIRHLIKKYETTSIDFADWEINGNPKELEKLCDMLLADGIKLDAWAEINARNVSPALLQKMKQAGISNVQVGIESFSPDVLRHIRKPATLLDNVKVLKWGVEAEMDSLLLNILCNHPLSCRRDVEENYRVIRLIAHLLCSPVTVVLNEMELYRTSEMFKRADHYKIFNIRDYKFYERCYPKGLIGTKVPMFNLSCRSIPLHPLWKKVDQFLEKIKRHPVRLKTYRLKDGVKVYDSRSFRRKTYRLQDIDGQVLYETLDKVTNQSDIVRTLFLPEEQVQASVNRLIRMGLILQDRKRCLGLPLRY